jgi:hypothetical protein
MAPENESDLSGFSRSTLKQSLKAEGFQCTVQQCTYKPDGGGKENKNCSNRDTQHHPWYLAEK